MKAAVFVDDDVPAGAPVSCFRCSAPDGRAATFRTFVGVVRGPVSPPPGVAARPCAACGWTNLFSLPS